MEYSRRDIICLRLLAAGEIPPEGPVPAGVTVPGLDEALELGGSVADRVALLADLEALKEAGLVTEAVRPVADQDERRRAYLLTAAGEEHARGLRRRAREATVTVTNGRTEEVRLSDVEQYFDDPPLVRALARMTPDGRVPIEIRSPDRFVGREAELDRLGDAYDALETRGGHAVLLAGESGVGKTALVEAFTRRLDDRATVARAGAEPDAGRPYDIVREICNALPLDADGGALLDEAGVPEDGADAAAGQRQSLFGDFADTFRTLAEERPLVVVFEDVHNADAETLALLEHLVDALGQWVYRVLFVCTYRPEAVDERHPLRSLIETVRTSERHECFALDPLDRQAVETVLRSRFEGDDPPPAVVDTVYDETGGNPLFVEAVASRFAEPGAGTHALPSDEAAIEVPETVSTAVQERLSVLDPAGRRVLELGAVIGELIDRTVLEAAADLPAPTVRDYVDLLVESGIWERLGEDLGFVHGVVRQTVLEDLEADTRAAYHRRVAGALETVAEDPTAQAAPLARHYEAAGDPAKAARAFEIAGDQAAAVYAYDIALDSYERGLAAAEASDAVPAERLVALARGATNVNLLVGDLEAADGSLALARQHATGEEPGSDPALAVLAGRLAIARGEFDEALACVGDAFDHLDVEPPGAPDQADPAAAGDAPAATGAGATQDEPAAERPVAGEIPGDAAPSDDGSADHHGLASDPEGPTRVETACRLLGLRAEAEMRRGNHEAAREAASRQRDLAAAANSRFQRARAHSRLGRVARHQADFDLMRTHYEAALAIYERLGADYYTAEATNGMAIGTLKAGDVDHALSLFTAALETYEEMGATPKVAKAHSNIGKAHLHQGRYDDATAAFERALEMDRDIGNRHLEVKTIFNLGLVAADRGDHVGAREYFQEALGICRALGDTHGETISRVRLGLALIHEGATDDAAPHLTEALEMAREIGARSAVATARMGLGDLARARDEPAEAREAYQTALDLFSESGERNEVATVLRKLAALALERDDVPAALEHGTAALEAFEELGATPDLVETFRLMADAAAAAGDRTAAVTYCDRAIDLFDDGVPADLPVDRTWFRERRRELAAGASPASREDDPTATDP